MRKRFSLSEILTHDPLGVLEILRRMPAPINKYVLLSNADVPSNYIHLSDYILKSDSSLVENLTKQYIGYMTSKGMNILAVTFKRDGLYLHGRNQNNLSNATRTSNAILNLQSDRELLSNYDSNMGKESNYGTQMFHVVCSDDLLIAERIIDYFLKAKI